MAQLPTFEMTPQLRELAERNGEQALRFAKQNAEAGFEMASEIAAAKDLQDILAIQARYAQTQMQAYALQAQELARLLTEAAQSATPKP